MMTSYFNLLKYAATGQASPDMTYYDKMRASTLMGGAVRTLTGIPPLSFPSNGSPITIWSMIGNGEQTGTPSPQSIIMPTFCGIKTGNLFDKSTITAGNYATLTGTTANSSYYCSDFIPITATTYYFQYIVGSSYQNSVVVYDLNKQGLRYEKLTGSAKVSGVITFKSGDAYIRINCYYNTAVDTVMLNLGSTALPYEPYGWAEKITCGGETTPVYLGEVPTVRRIRKLVLTGEEDISYDSTYTRFSIKLPGCLLVAVRRTPAFCTHYEVIDDGRSISDVPNNSMYSHNADERWYIKATDYSTADAFKDYLASEYQAGRPVTIWYILAESTTGFVNEPLCKIGDYADELHSEDAGVTIPTVKGQNALTVDTPIQPSEMTITYRE